MRKPWTCPRCKGTFANAVICPHCDSDHVSPFLAGRSTAAPLGGDPQIHAAAGHLAQANRAVLQSTGLPAALVRQLSLRISGLLDELKYIKLESPACPKKL